jgi:hypothetical protein
MDPLTLAAIWLVKSLIAGSVAAATVSAVVYIARLTLPIVLAWFRQNNTLSMGNSNLVGATIQKGLREGKYTIVQGVFDKRTKTMVESRTIETNQLDDELARRHRNQDVVLYASYEY